MSPHARWGLRGLLGGLLWLAPASGSSVAYPLREVGLGQPARPFSLRDGQGRAQSLSAYAGKPVVLGYLRAGQGFSDQALAAWGRLHKRFSSKGVVFLGLWHKDADAAAAAPGPAAFPLLEDGQRAVYGSYGLFILPTSVVLDREHRVAAAVGGYSEALEDELEAALNGVLGIKAAPKPAPRYGQPGEIQDPAVNQARLLLKDGRAHEALAALGGASERQPCPARLVMAETLLKLNRAADAKARLEPCLAEPTPQAATLMGQSLSLLGDAAEAETWLKKAVASSPDPRARFYLGQLYEKAGRKDEALAQYRAALERELSR
ncbi:MAG: redoxin domain-containing protein [Elusimicrobia bacterium]|nr:redoxin domain-containing protein [Elusimicrobiota bacterium]